MSGGITLPAHRKKHDLSSPIDHEGNIYEGLMAAVNAITGLNPAADQKFVLDQILAALKGLDWQESVLSREAVQPGAPTTGDRYIATATAGDWNENSIYEWDGAAWIETVPNKGTTAVVEAEALAYTFIVTPVSKWVTLGSIINHAALNGLAWSVAGHIIDSDVDMADFNIDNIREIMSNRNLRIYVDTNVEIQLGDKAGLYSLDIKDSDGNGVCAIDSVGRIGLSDNIDMAPGKTVDGVDVSAHALDVDAHHDKSHSHDGVDGSGTVAHGDLTGIGTDDHHTRYADSEAVTAMGTKADSNPLNHDKYTDGEAIAAIGKKAGIVPTTAWGAGNPKKTTITFATPYADNDYAIVITGEDSRSWSVESKSASGFVINCNANATPTGNTFWIAMKAGE